MENIDVEGNLEGEIRLARPRWLIDGEVLVEMLRNFWTLVVEIRMSACIQEITRRLLIGSGPFKRVVDEKEKIPWLICLLFHKW